MRSSIRKKINSLYGEIRDLSRDIGAPEDLEFVGKGTSRIVFRINSGRFGSENRGRVVKFAMNGNGKLDNRLEKETWESVKKTDIQDFFCPIRACEENYNWLVMDYCEDATGNPSVEGFKRTLLDRTGNMPDLQDENVGIHSRRGLVLRDYSWGSNIINQ